MTKNNSQRNKGFTLIEMLVVVAIIAVLSTIVFFAIDKARSQGRDTARVTAIGQLQVALKLYYDEHGEYPNASSDPSYPDCTGSGAASVSFSSTGCMNVLVKEKLIPALPKQIGNSEYEYDVWCRGTGSNVRQYRLWVYGENDHNGLAQNWWDDEVIGATTCADPS